VCAKEARYGSYWVGWVYEAFLREVGRVVIPPIVDSIIADGVLKVYCVLQSLGLCFDNAINLVICNQCVLTQ
jgi:hypothetical protein